MQDDALHVLKQYGEHLSSYIGPRPWDPFPRTSEWGRQIDKAYREDQLRRRASPLSDGGQT